MKQYATLPLCPHLRHNYEQLHPNRNNTIVQNTEGTLEVRYSLSLRTRTQQIWPGQLEIATGKPALTDPDFAQEQGAVQNISD